MQEGGSPRPMAGRGGEQGGRARAGRRRKKTKKRAEGTVAATRGGDLWWDYRWRYFFITVSPGRVSLFSSSYPLRPSSSPLRGRRSLLAAAGPSRFSPREKLHELLRHCLYLPTSVTYTPPRARSARGGLYLNNIHELRYTPPDLLPRHPRILRRPANRPLSSTLLPSSYVPWSSHFASFVFLVSLRSPSSSLGPRFCPPCR